MPRSLSYCYNADLFDLWPVGAAAPLSASNGPPFSESSIAVFAFITLAFAASVLLYALYKLVRFYLAQSLAQSSLSVFRLANTFQGKYCLLVCVMACTSIILNILRLSALFDPSPSLFPWRVGASNGLNALLFLTAIAFITSLSVSVQNTVKIALSTGTKSNTKQAFPAAGPASPRSNASSSSPSSLSATQHAVNTFQRILIFANVFQWLIWSLLFILSGVNDSETPQLVIVSLLILLGNVPYYILALSMILATRAIAMALQVNEDNQGAQSAGLNSAQRASRQTMVSHFSLASGTVSRMVQVNALFSVIFFILFVAVSDYRIAIYWPYLYQCYICLVVLIRLYFVKVTKDAAPSSSAAAATAGGARVKANQVAVAVAVAVTATDNGERKTDG